MSTAECKKLVSAPHNVETLQQCSFFGNLEVILKTAFSILLANVDTCVKDWKIGIENCKHDPMGEDLFADIGMRKNGVTGTEVFDITKAL